MRKKVSNETDIEFCSSEVNSMLTETLTSLGFNPNVVKNYIGIEKVPCISTGIINLDQILKGGFPRKTIVELFGPPGGGKSFIALMTMAAATRRGERCLYLDAEGGFNPERARELGVNLRLVDVIHEFMYGEQLLDLVCNILFRPDYEETHEGKPQPKPYSVIVIDSIAVLASKEEMEADYVQMEDVTSGAKERLGARGRMMSKYQPRLLRAINNSSGIWVEDMKFAFSSDGDIISLSYNDLPDDIRMELENVISIRSNMSLENIIYGDELFYDIIKLKDMIQEQEQEKTDDIIKAITKMDYNILTGFFERTDKDTRSFVEQIIKKIKKGFNTKVNENVSDEFLEFERNVLRGKVINTFNEGLRVVHYNEGPVVIAINQVRTGNLGGYTGPTEERPGGMALKFAAGTAIRVDQMKGRDAEILDQNTKEIVGIKSRAKIVKSRFAPPLATCEIIIPLTGNIDILSSFLDLCAQNKLYGYIRGKHRIPREGEAVINTASLREFYEQLLEFGLQYLAEKLGWENENIEPITDAIMARLENLEEE